MKTRHWKTRSGGAALALAALLAAGSVQALEGVPTTVWLDGPYTQAEFDADMAITARVAAVLAADPKLRGRSIEVSTRRGEVILRGQVTNASMVYRTVELVRRVEGVRGIDETGLLTS